jgi:hypothetical protein
MTDYTRGTGTTGTMMIRDTGSSVEFWIHSGSSSTWVGSLGWSGTVNGSGVSGSTRYNAGAGWVRLGYWGVGYSQEVTFNIANTGTSGFGGPTSFSVWINRSSPPNPPSQVNLYDVASTSLRAHFDDGADNGAGIDARELLYGTDSNTHQYSVWSNGTSEVYNLTPGATYYFWARTHNSQGWSGVSERASVTMRNYPNTPVINTIDTITPTSMVVHFEQGYDGGASIIEYQVGYSTVPEEVSGSINSSNEPIVVISLTPATSYYVKVRSRNGVGWSNWSSEWCVRTIGGARIKVNGVWVEAIPYVKFNGVWRLARPLINVGGVWKEAS